MILTEVSAPPAAAVPVRAFAEHLRLGSGFADDGSEDAVLELYLRAAMAAIEARLGRALLARDFSWTVTRWREDASQGLPIGPVRAVDVGDAGGRRTAARRPVDPEAWSVLRDSQRPRLVGRFGRNLPRIPRSGHAEIRFTAGFGEGWDEVPADLRQAVFLLAAHFYENRSDGGSIAGSMPFGVLVLIEAYRATRIGGGCRDGGGQAARAGWCSRRARALPDGSGGFAVAWVALGHALGGRDGAGRPRGIRRGRGAAAGAVPDPRARRAGRGRRRGRGRSSGSARGRGSSTS